MNRYDSEGKFLMLNLMSERKSKGLSQAELGKLIGTNNIQVSRVETGLQFPLSTTLFKMAKVLDVSMDYLMEGYDPSKHDGNDDNDIGGV